MHASKSFFLLIDLIGALLYWPLSANDATLQTARMVFMAMCEGTCSFFLVSFGVCQMYKALLAISYIRSNRKLVTAYEALTQEEIWEELTVTSCKVQKQGDGHSCGWRVLLNAELLLQRIYGDLQGSVSK